MKFIFVVLIFYSCSQRVTIKYVPPDSVEFKPLIINSVSELYQRKYYYDNINRVHRPYKDTVEVRSFLTDVYMDTIFTVIVRHEMAVKIDTVSFGKIFLNH